MWRISTKLTLAAAVAIASVMAVNGASRLERERETFRADIEHDHLVLGRALAETTGTLFDLAGPEEALRAVEQADQRRQHVRIHWRTTAEESIASEEQTEGRERFLVTRVPVVTEAGAVGAIELRESLAPLDEYARGTLARIAWLAALSVAVCAALIHLAGWLVVERPLRRLIAAIRRIGQGELTAALPVEGRDELALLGRELDEMRRQLDALGREAARESDARLSALEQLRHADRLSTVGKLAAGVAHELGTPLNVVAARAKMIRAGESTGAEIPEDARVIGEQAERMTKIIRQLLDFARPRPADRAEHDLRALAEGAAELLAPVASKAGVSLAVVAGEPVPARVDAGQIHQVLTNLVLNAIQAQPDGGEVQVAVHATPSAWTVEVRDRGPGLTPEARERLFEPFFTTKPIGEGTGLGLSVVHGIVEEHGGSIEVSDAEGQGTVLTIRLPRSPRGEG